MVEIRMPSLGADMEAGTMVEWLVNEVIGSSGRHRRGRRAQKGAIEIKISNR